MAKIIVYPAEPGEVSHQHRARAPRQPVQHRRVYPGFEQCAVGQAGEPVVRRGALQIDRAAVQVHHGAHAARQILQPGAFGRRERAGRAIDEAQRAERFAIRGTERRAGVEADAGVAGHQRIVDKPWVQGRILDQQNLVRPMNGVGAEGLVARSFARIKAHHCLEPLAVLIDQGDDRNRHVEHVGGELDNVVEPFVLPGVEYVLRDQRGQAQFLMVGRGRRGHE